jgi:TolB-like protein
VSKNLNIDKPGLAIFPFEDISESKKQPCFIKGLEMCLATDLTSKDIRLISYFSATRVYEKTHDIKEAGTQLNASFILTGCVQFGKHLRVHILLNACDTGAQLWALTVEKRDVGKLDLFSLQEEIASQVMIPVLAAITHYNEDACISTFDGSTGAASAQLQPANV